MAGEKSRGMCTNRSVCVQVGEFFSHFGKTLRFLGYENLAERRPSFPQAEEGRQGSYQGAGVPGDRFTWGLLGGVAGVYLSDCLGVWGQDSIRIT
jgi:hypothetical protein